MQDVQKGFLLGQTAVQALQGVSLEINPGDFVAIMGPSGSGKSTLMNIIGFLDRPSVGSYFFEDREVSRQDDDALALLRNRRIGFVFQSFNLLPRYSALKNVELPMLYADVTPRERRERATAVLADVGLADRKEHKPGQMSGGEQQRVAIARALVNRPALLLADEPTGNLDTRSGNEIIELFVQLHRKGTTLIVITHNREVAMHARRIFHMRDGRIIDEEHLA